MRKKSNGWIILYIFCSLLLTAITLYSFGLFPNNNIEVVENHWGQVEFEIDSNQKFHHMAPIWVYEDEIFLPFESGESGLIVDRINEGTKEIYFNYLNNSDCPTGRIEAWGKVSDERIGYVLECRLDNLRLLSHKLIEFDYQEPNLRLVAEIPRPLHPDYFSMNSDSSAILVQMNGDGLYNKQYFFNRAENNWVPLMVSANRSGWGSWSPDGEVFVLGAVDENKIDFGNVFSGLGELIRRSKRSWGLYILEDENDEPELILDGIEGLEFVKWSPTNKNLIAFRGKFENLTGLWVFDTEKNKLTLIWPEKLNSKHIRFDWSPSGEELVIIDCQSGLDNFDCFSAIISHPSLS